MAQGQWQITNAPATNTAASAAVTATAGQGQCIRLWGLQATLSGTSAGASTVTVYDGTNTGTVIWQGSLACAANGSDNIIIPDTDIRAVSGTLTVAATAGGAGTSVTVNAQGDLPVIGYSGFAV